MMRLPDSGQVKRWVRFPGLAALAFVVAILLIEWTTPARTTETLGCNPDEAMVVSPDRGHVCIKDWRAPYRKAS